MSIAKSGRMLVLFGTLAVAIGCSGSAASDGLDSEADGSGQPTSPLAQDGAVAFDQSNGYLHQASGVGFVYPRGWEILGVKSQGSETSLGLRKGRGDVEATLSWTETEPGIDDWTVGLNEYEALRSLYKDNVHRPESIMRGPRHGYRLAIVGGPLGIQDPESLGVVYLFVARRGQQAWTVKLRATARGSVNLAHVDELLGQYRW
jgi:hypothetical protein